jgi:hypothetical protein
MLIAQEKKKTNIAEYILYMWQIEDLIRATGFDMEKIENDIISKYQINNNMRIEIREWYTGLVESMVREGISKAGHLMFVNRHLMELDTLHHNLLANTTENEYHTIFAEAKPNIEVLRAKGNLENISDIELCFNGLYGLLLLRLAKRSVTEETETAMKTISNLLAHLTTYYHKLKSK